MEFSPMTRRSSWSSRRLAAAALAVVATVLLGITAVAPPPPGADQVRAAHRPSESWLLDRSGRPLQVVRSDMTRRQLGWVALDETSPAVIELIVAAEDRRFHRHPGVDVRALARELAGIARRRPVGGASTITMQLAGQIEPALAAPAGRRTIGQKLRQMHVALRIERAWSKDRILEAYLNLAPFRGELVGIGAAAFALFDKAPIALGRHEAALLAALLPAPNAPPERVAVRACRLLDAAECPGLAALAAERLGRPGGVTREIALAPHAAQLLRGRLAPGARLATTLDAAVQERAQIAVANHLGGLSARNVRDAAVLVVDNATAELRAHVGGSGRLSSARFVDGTRAPRQAGSTLKPFIYGLAFDRRLLTAATLLEDSAIEVQTAAGGVYRPRNYDNRFRGPISVREALAGSVNTPAVRAIYLAGIGETVDLLRRAGLESLREPGFYGASLALGSADVTLWEMASAYRALAAGGMWRPLRLLPDGEPDEPRRILSAEAAFVLGSILSDRAGRAATFGLASPLDTASFTAVKTGTSKDMRDNWCIGWSAEYTVAVWVGNFGGAPMWNVTGVSGACPIWQELMAWLHRGRPGRPPVPPPGLVAHPVSFGEGRAARTEWFLAGTEPHGEAVLPVAAAGPPAIAYPVSGTMVAVDPDIPPEAQRIIFRGRAPYPGLEWRLNDERLGDAALSLPWAPFRGTHVLALTTPDGTAVATAEFVVR
jgi:penicillin-binding protein 1C